MNGRDLLTEFRKLPRVTRALLASTVTVTLSCIAQITSPSMVVYTYGLAFQKLPIWRLYTSFFLATHRMMDQLESGPHGPYARRSADLALQLFVADILILILSIPIRARAPGRADPLFGLVTLPVTYLPYIMVGTDLLNGGPHAAVIALPGAVVGYMWWWSVWGSAKYMGEVYPLRRADGATGANIGRGVIVVPLGDNILYPLIS
ncbi:hypothetical protein B0H14DRAFT_3424901 [Mycena olivaceomarginata]|nr:hypothetical protein B0H14DRAFT_3424901 [Mycena olivaceomarginata]